MMLNLQNADALGTELPLLLVSIDCKYIRLCGLTEIDSQFHLASVYQTRKHEVYLLFLAETLCIGVFKYSLVIVQWQARISDLR